MNPLDRLDRVTMHKLVQSVLTGLILVACIVGAFGLIPYGPPAIIVTAVILAAACIGANAGLSRLYGVRSDSQSALITALILTLVITPTLSPVSLALAALIGVVSQASKYVLAVRGRHVFNPVAIALAIGSLSGLFYPSWWVASPPLAVVTAVGALVTAYKTRLIGIVGGFVALSAAIITLRAVTGGIPVAESIAATFTSWPILFFAGFMLTEPTTLPPRSWQKYAVTALVALIFALPFTLGPVSSSPALALVIGNAIAFFFGQRRAIKLTLRGTVRLTPSVREFVFAPEAPLRFTPGQYLDLFIPHDKSDFKSSRRSFSLTSVPRTGTVSLGIRIGDAPSSYKRVLAALTPGETVVASTVSGDFTLPRDPERKLLFIAGGIGITPFISQLRTLRETGEKRDIVLLYFVRSHEDNAYPDDVRQADGRILTGQVTPDLLRENAPDIAERTVYVSGPPAMVRAAKKYARLAGARRIRTDYFSGY